MNSLTTPAASARKRDGKDAARMWLDALVKGTCEKDRFLREMDALAQAGPDACWDVLSVVDQYFRLKKIERELFSTVKLRLERRAFGLDDSAEVSVPLPLVRPQSGLSQDAAPVQQSPQWHRAGFTVHTTPAAAERHTKSSAPRAQETGSKGELAEGDVLRERYRLGRMLGTGGTGTVFEAIDQYRVDQTTLSQSVAVKVLHRAVTERGDVVIKLRSEFWRLQSLSHPNIVRVFELDRDGDLDFFTMELLHGVPLGRLLGAQNGRTLQRSNGLAIIRDIGAALAHAHSRGVVHGDISPDNILITTDGEVRVLDFGASRKPKDGPWIADSELPQPSPVAAPSFASSQLLSGQMASFGDDIYAFACISYVVLAGRHPFEGHTAVEAQTLRIRPRRPDRLSRRQWRTLRRALDFARERRPRSVAEFLNGLDLKAAARHLPTLSVLMNPTPDRRRGASIVTMEGILLMLLAATGLWLALGRDEIVRDVTSWTADAAGVMNRTGNYIGRIWAGATSSGANSGDQTGARPTAGLASGAGITQQSPRAASLNRSLAIKTRADTDAASTVAPQPVASAPATRAVVELAAPSIEVSASSPIARVMVRRTGNLRGDVRFTWWTESGTAKPGEDYVPSAPRTEYIADGFASAGLVIPLVSDTTRRLPKGFYVMIGEAGPGASLGARTTTMVVMSGAE
jgi:serine/threonine protein kinase